MLDIQSMVEEFDPIRKTNEYIKYKLNFMKEHPNYFTADGLVLFVGMQGKGKTLSAVNYTYNLLKNFPHAKLCTNLMLKDYPIVTFEEWLLDFDEEKYNFYLDLNEKGKEIFENEHFNIYLKMNRVFPFNNQDDLMRYRNGEKGMIFLIDEIQLYFNSLESKNINMDVMVTISQQRKQRIHIIGTSQVFGRMAKPLREQFNVVVVCDKYFNFIQCNKIVNRDDIQESTDDMHVEGKVMRKCWFIHSPRYYGRYDTYYTISRTKFVSNEQKKGDIYDSRTNTTNN